MAARSVGRSVGRSDRRLLIQFKSTSDKGASGCAAPRRAVAVVVIFNFGAARKINGMNDARGGESDT